MSSVLHYRDDKHTFSYISYKHTFSTEWRRTLQLTVLCTSLFWCGEVLYVIRPPESQLSDGHLAARQRFSDVAVHWTALETSLRNTLPSWCSSSAAGQPTALSTNQSMDIFSVYELNAKLSYVLFGFLHDIIIRQLAFRSALWSLTSDDFEAS